MDYVAAATNNLAYVGAVEKLVGLVVPPRARYIRTILAELQRISSHLLWLATHAIDIGAMTPFFYCFREREQILDLFEQYCGARLTLNCMRPGGLPHDLPVGWTDALPRVRRRCSRRRSTSTRACLTENRIWKKRTVGDRRAAAGGGDRLRHHRPDAARQRHRLGPAQGDALRGLRRGRVRRAGAAERRHLRPLSRAHGGDAAGQPHHPSSASTSSPRGRSWPSARACSRRPRTARSTTASRGPRGRSASTSSATARRTPTAATCAPPSFVNLQSLPELTKGHLLADLVALIGTTDIVLGEVDR